MASNFVTYSTSYWGKEETKNISPNLLRVIFFLICCTTAFSIDYLYKLWSEWLQIFPTAKILIFFQLTKPSLTKLSFLCWKRCFSCIMNGIFMSFWSVVVAFWSIISLFVVLWMVAKTYFAKKHCTLMRFLWFTEVKYVKFVSFLISIESTSSLFYRLDCNSLI